MIVVYRPELSNPPKAAESSIGFSLLPQGDERKTVHVRIENGVTRNFDESAWERIKDFDLVKNLIGVGALEIKDEEPAPVVQTSRQDHIKDVSLTDALQLIEASFDIQQLQKWDAKDQRIKVKNAIGKRIAAISEGNG